MTISSIFRVALQARTVEPTIPATPVANSIVGADLRPSKVCRATFVLIAVGTSFILSPLEKPELSRPCSLGWLAVSHLMYVQVDGDDLAIVHVLDLLPPSLPGI